MSFFQVILEKNLFQLEIVQQISGKIVIKLNILENILSFTFSETTMQVFIWTGNDVRIALFGIVCT